MNNGNGSFNRSARMPSNGYPTNSNDPGMPRVVCGLETAINTSVIYLNGRRMRECEPISFTRRDNRNNVISFEFGINIQIFENMPIRTTSAGINQLLGGTKCVQTLFYSNLC